MKKHFKKITLLLALTSSMDCYANTLFVQSDLNDPSMGESAVDILQCINLERADNWELVDQVKEQEPSLVFSEQNQTLHAKLKTNGKIVEVTKNHCKEILSLLGISQKTEITLAQLAPQTGITPELLEIEEPKAKNFLADNWLWLAGGAVIITGLLSYQSFNKRHPNTRVVSIFSD
jgi:hypothetical protein